MNDTPLKRSKSRTLRTLTREHYHGQALRPESLAALLSRIEMASATGSTRGDGGLRPARWFSRRAAMAAGLLIALMLGGWLMVDRAWLAHGPAVDGVALTRAIAVEAATTHRKQYPPEVHPTSMAECGTMLDRLDFEPRQPRDPVARALSVEGARYCTVQGGLAVQAMLRDGRGQTHSLFQVRLDDTLARAEATEQRIGDLNVAVWREDDLLMVLVGP